MTEIEKICLEVYGCGVAVAPAEAIIWSVERIADKEDARAALRLANKIRARHGRPLVYAPYGHHAF